MGKIFKKLMREFPEGTPVFTYGADSENDEEAAPSKGLQECDCPICGKHFVKQSATIYKHKVCGKTKSKSFHWYFCSYKCWRALEKELELEESERKEKSNEKTCNRKHSRSNNGNKVNSNDNHKDDSRRV